MITDITGIRVGHWTDERARTGCTVVLVPHGTIASGEVRGGAPATRELDLLVPGRLVERIDAVLLTGGSAFGLAAADGVMRWCEERGLGFRTPAGPVPIVPSLALFDLAVGAADVRPGADAGHAACRAATEGPVALGRVGAGTGAMVDKWRGAEHATAGGLASATRGQGDLLVSALVAVNASGAVDVDGRGAAAAAERLADGAATDVRFGNTTIGVVATNAALTKLELWLVAQSAHDGLARSVAPAHTRGDGDGFVTLATGEVEGSVDVVRTLAVAAVEAAIASVGTSPV